MFRNGEGWLLHHGEDWHGWQIGPALGSWVLRCDFSVHDPATARNWYDNTKTNGFYLPILNVEAVGALG